MQGAIYIINEDTSPYSSFPCFEFVLLLWLWAHLYIYPSEVVKSQAL